MSSEPELMVAREQVLAQIRAADRFLLATHEHPDGDALGSLVAMHGILSELGKDSIMFMPADELPLPYEYRFFQLEGMVGVLPEDLVRRTVIFLDCGNIDHHHDNTLFGTVNYVVPDASCTAEIVWDLLRALDVSPSTEVAEALYVGLVTDTGRFMYENTGPRAHVMAAELIEAGVDVHAIYRCLYEEIPFAKLALFARALGRAERYDDGRLTVTRLTIEDYAAAAAEESYSEGVIDLLRAVHGTRVAVLVRDMLAEGKRGARKVSLRASDDEVDVSVIARLKGGGGHRRAAGFSTELTDEELIEFLREQVAVQLAATPI
jgi:phosphoesterase RecJ-like protein